MTYPGQRTHHEHGWWWTLISDRGQYFTNPYARTLSESPFTSYIERAWACRTVKDIGIIQDALTSRFDNPSDNVRRLYRFYVRVKDGIAWYYPGVTVNADFRTIYEEEEQQGGFFVELCGGYDEQVRYAETFEDSLRVGKTVIEAHTHAIIDCYKVNHTAWNFVKIPLQVKQELLQNEPAKPFNDFVIQAGGEPRTATAMIPKPQRQNDTKLIQPQTQIIPPFVPSPRMSVRRFKSKLSKLGGVKTE